MEKIRYQPLCLAVGLPSIFKLILISFFKGMLFFFSSSDVWNIKYWIIPPYCSLTALQGNVNVGAKQWCFNFTLCLNGSIYTNHFLYIQNQCENLVLALLKWRRWPEFTCFWHAIGECGNTTKVASALHGYGEKKKSIYCWQNPFSQVKKGIMVWRIQMILSK